MGDFATEIDVIIPCFNGESFILRALNSVNAQTHPPKRVIVVDDGSTDKSAELAKGFSTARFELTVHSQENGGLSSARNSGIRLSSAPFLAFLDCDDEWLPEKLELQAREIQDGGSSLGLVFCDWIDIDEFSNEIANSPWKTEKKLFVPKNFNELLKGNRIYSSGSGVLIRKKCFDEVGFFDESLRAIEDWDMWLRVIQKYGVKFIPKPLTKLRRHLCSMQTDSLKMYRNTLVFFNKWCSFLPITAIPMVWRIQIAVWFVKSNPSKELVEESLSLLASKSRRKLFWFCGGSFRLFLLGVAVLYPFAKRKGRFLDAGRVSGDVIKALLGTVGFGVKST